LLLAKPEVLSDQERHPAVIVLHGTGGKKEEQMDWLKDLAGRGFVAVAIDARYHGERGDPAKYNAAIAQAFADGKSHPLYYDEVWDQMRLIDYLQTRPQIDPKRIGMIGISKGGIESWLTAAVDPRVACVVPCISVQCFKWGLDNDGWHGRISTVQKGFDLTAKAEGIVKPDSAFVQKFYDHLIPGIYTQYDCPRMLELITPRPMLVISGEKDPINPLPGMKIAEAAAKKAYETANAADQFDVIVEAGIGHAVNKDAHAKAMEWFEKCLKPGE
jgi:predicted esterase